MYHSIIITTIVGLISFDFQLIQSFVDHIRGGKRAAAREATDAAEMARVDAEQTAAQAAADAARAAADGIGFMFQLGQETHCARGL